MISARARRAGVAPVLLACLALVAGCGGSSSSEATTTGATTSAGETGGEATSKFTPLVVEKLIRKSIQPTLAANLGEGATMKVTCKSTGNGKLSCVTILVPADSEIDTIRVVYGVTCDARTCEWQPTG